MVDNLDNIIEMSTKVVEIIIGIAAVLTALATIFERLKPAIKFLAFLGTQIIPNGIIVWVWLYIAAVNANRLAEPVIFLSGVGQETALLVIYNFIWGIWVYPKVKYLLPNFLFAKEKPKEGGTNAKKPTKNKR